MSTSSLRPADDDPTTSRDTAPTAPSVIDCAVYVDGVRRPGRCSYDDAIARVRADGEGFVWVGLRAPDLAQMTAVAQTFGLHELMVADAVRAHQRPKIERYDDTHYVVLRTVTYVEHASLSTTKEVVDSGEILVFVGADFIVTVRHGEFTELAGVRRELEARPDRLALGPYAALHAITDHVVDTYVAVTAAVETDVDLLEESVFAPDQPIDIDSVYLLKREIAELRRAVTPLSAPLHRLSSPESDLCPKEIRRYFRDVHDHHTAVAERVGAFDEVLTSLLEAASAKIGIQQNTDLRKISAWVAIVSVPTMVVGIYGMNFDHMPELRWQYGYHTVLASLVVVCLVLWRTFRRNRWL